MRIPALVVLCVLAASATPRLPQRAGPVSPVGDGWHVAFRVDDQRVAMIFTGGEIYLPQRAFESLLSQSPWQTRTSSPGRLAEVPPDRLQDIVRDAARVGDRWTLDAGRGGRFHLTVERLVLGDRDCGEGWGVIAAVNADEATRFRAIQQDHFAARIDRPGAGPSASPAALGEIPFAMNAQRRTQLAALLNAERARTWPAIRREASTRYAGHEDPQDSRLKAWANKWRAIDAQLDAGKAVIDFKVRAFRLTPDGDPRVFVQARWAVGRDVAFALTAWLRAGKTLSLDSADVTAADRMRMDEFEGVTFGFESMSSVLAVLDTNGDGVGEPLMIEYGYESMNLVLLEYPKVPGTTPKEITVYSNGC